MLSHDLVQDLQNVLLFGFVAKCHLIVGQFVHNEACILIQLDKLSQVINFVGQLFDTDECFAVQQVFEDATNHDWIESFLVSRLGQEEVSIDLALLDVKLLI